MIRRPRGGRATGSGRKLLIVQDNTSPTTLINNLRPETVIRVVGPLAYKGLDKAGLGRWGQAARCYFLDRAEGVRPSIVVF